MKVVVTGSYRAHEPDYFFAAGRWDEFKAAARALGRELAKKGHHLLLCWSYNNVFSQLGAKDKERGNPASHPYWETADYHALMGYLENARDHAGAVRKGAVDIRVLGRDKRFPGDLN